MPLPPHHHPYTLLIAFGVWLSGFPGGGSPQQPIALVRRKQFFRGGIRLSSLLEGVNKSRKRRCAVELSLILPDVNSINQLIGTQKTSLKHPIVLSLLATPTTFVSLQHILSRDLASVNHDDKDAYGFPIRSCLSLRSEFIYDISMRKKRYTATRSTNAVLFADRSSREFSFREVDMFGCAK